MRHFKMSQKKCRILFSFTSDGVRAVQQNKKMNERLRLVFETSGTDGYQLSLKNLHGGNQRIEFRQLLRR